MPRVSYNLSSVLMCRQPKGVERKTKEHKSRSGVNCQGALKHKGIKQMGIQQGLPVFFIQMF
jgi:hypothetical protein